MHRSTFNRAILFSLVCLGIFPLVASAQSSIVGLVRDESGGVLPGVTVEAASPVLIEKVRTGVTDDQGRYRIVDLRPGIYRLTIALAGFSTMVRDGLELPTNFTLTINADLKVGSLQETVTVSGQTPVVDVQQASRTQVMTRDLLDSLPVSRNILSVGQVVPGIRSNVPDIGGSRVSEQVGMRARGVSQRYTAQLVDGMSIQYWGSDGGYLHYWNDNLAAEISITTSAIPADTEQGGIRLNSIPRDGGNIMTGAIFLGGSDGSWQSKNVDDELGDVPSPVEIQRRLG